MSNIAIQVKNLTKVYHNKTVANDKINISIYEGEIFGLLGPNGAGKTTFVKQILGLLLPTEGEIKILDVDVVKYPQKIKNFVNYLGQSPYALWHLTVWEAVFYTALLKNVEKNSAKENTEKLLRELNIEKYKNTLLGYLSGGILRITNFAQAIISPCNILILDEPTSGLDPLNKRNIWNKILQLNREKNITIILVTHDVLEAEKVLTRVGFIKNSKIIAEGTPYELKKCFKENLKIEIQLHHDKEVDSDLKKEIEKFGEILFISKNTLILLPPKDKAISNISEILKFPFIEDIKITSPNLEDVYIKLSGEKID